MKRNCQNTRMLKIYPGILAGFVGLLLYGFSPLSVQGAGLKHLIPTDDAFDCYACHKIATPKIAQNWYESKHGMILVKCFVCHGQPDGKGSIPWTVSPDPKAVCQKCHDPAMKRMEAKFGVKLNCVKCHPFHQDSLHHDAYKKTQSKSQ
ncbi:MAG: hypothetical protein DSY50_00010 [Desulfobulbus sp.]|nr:MAG: hypothetical protein DSY50_00010 [Desulfobulbus sp.]RUM38001.1 MAG: hypothetical protein DSY70_08685 [Desulfobulbus sp.]